MTTKPIIRAARPSDDAVLGELLVDAYLTAYQKKMPEVVVTAERKSDLRNVAEKRALATVLVLEVGGEVAGTVSLYPPLAPGSEAWLPGAADLRYLAVSPRFHGRGFSGPLLDRAEELARSAGIPVICLHVRRGARGLASLYQGRGYQPDPTGNLEFPSVSLQAFFKKLDLKQ